MEAPWIRISKNIYILGYLPGIYIFLVIKVLSQRTKWARQRPSHWNFQSIHNPGQVVEPPKEDES